VLVSRTDLSELRQALLASQPAWVVVGLVGYLFSQVISAYRWNILAVPLGFTESFRQYLHYYFVGMYWNLFAPSTVAGDIGRTVLLARGRRRALAFTSVVADRSIGLVALVWVGALAILLVPSFPLPDVARLSAWLAPPVTIAAWLWGPRLAVRFLPKNNRWRHFVEHELVPYWRDRRVLLAGMLVSFVFHTVQVLSQVALARALGVRLPWYFFFVFVPIVNIAGMAPVSFSGIGVREAGYWYFLSALGIDRETAIALGLLSSAVVLANGLTGGVIFLLGKEGTSSPAGETAPR
jgi:uncharacterized membrane protein YbhN (UPF0104 family)